MNTNAERFSELGRFCVAAEVTRRSFLGSPIDSAPERPRISRIGADVGVRFGATQYAFIRVIRGSKALLLSLALGLCGSSASATIAPMETAAAPAVAPTALPVKALMMFFPPRAEMDRFLQFVRRDLPQAGVNHLILQIDYGYQFKCRPEMAGDRTEAEVKAVVAACRAAGIKLIPLVNCLGHQSWAETTHRLLTVHPEFDETPGLYPKNDGIYCRSYCPNHPQVHAVIFDLLAEIAEVFEADAVHVGMDEVFLLGEAACPRCQGRDPAELFAQEVRTLRDFLHGRGVRLWLWGDRLLDGRTTGLGKWEASLNNTHRAIDLVPKDIVVCDWHYEAAPATAAYFALRGFDVVACSWNRPAIAAAQADQIFALRAAPGENTVGPRLLGVMATIWEAPEKFLENLKAVPANGAGREPSSAENFVRLFERVRELETKAAGKGN